MWKWFTPWFTMIASTVVLGAIAYFLYDNTYWFRETALRSFPADKVVSRMHILHLHAAMVKRSVGLFSGFSLVFLGLGVVFYHVRSRSSLGVQTPTIGVEVVSASPGVIAIVLGVVLLMTTIASKDSFPPYLGELRDAPGATPTDEEIVRPSEETMRLLEGRKNEEDADANDGDRSSR